MKRKWKLKKSYCNSQSSVPTAEEQQPRGTQDEQLTQSGPSTSHLCSRSHKQREISEPSPTASPARLDSMAELTLLSPVSGLHAMILHLPASSHYQTALHVCVCTHKHKGSAKHKAFWYELLQMFHPPPDLTSVPPSVAAADLGCFFSELTPSI